MKQSWHATTREGKPFTLMVKDEMIMWYDSEKHETTIVDFFTKYNPLRELPLPEQGRVLHELSQHITFDHEPDQHVKAYIAFWKCFPDLLIINQTYSFQTRISDISEWRLHLTKNGLTWHDLSNHYSQTNKIKEQTLADFWFYGPLYPLPSLDIRKEIVEITKDALQRTGYPYNANHFPLIHYPTFVMGPQWVDGDYVASNFVIMREYGIEDGRENFHDGLVWLNFTSFEHCLTRHDLPEYNLTKEIVNEIREMIREANPGMQLYPI